MIPRLRFSLRTCFLAFMTVALLTAPIVEASKNKKPGKNNNKKVNKANNSNSTSNIPPSPSPSPTPTASKPEVESEHDAFYREKIQRIIDARSFVPRFLSVLIAKYDKHPMCKIPQVGDECTVYSVLNNLHLSIGSAILSYVVKKYDVPHDQFFSILVDSNMDYVQAFEEFKNNELDDAVDKMFQDLLSNPSDEATKATKEETKEKKVEANEETKDNSDLSDTDQAIIASVAANVAAGLAAGNNNPEFNEIIALRDNFGPQIKKLLRVWVERVVGPKFVYGFYPANFVEVEKAQDRFKDLNGHPFLQQFFLDFNSSYFVFLKYFTSQLPTLKSKAAGMAYLDSFQNLMDFYGMEVELLRSALRIEMDSPLLSPFDKAVEFNASLRLKPLHDKLDKIFEGKSEEDKSVAQVSSPSPTSNATKKASAAKETKATSMPKESEAPKAPIIPVTEVKVEKPVAKQTKEPIVTPAEPIVASKESVVTPKESNAKEPVSEVKSKDEAPSVAAPKTSQKGGKPANKNRRPPGALKKKKPLTPERNPMNKKVDGQKDDGQKGGDDESAVEQEKVPVAKAVETKTPEVSSVSEVSTVPEVSPAPEISIEEQSNIEESPSEDQQIIPMPDPEPEPIDPALYYKDRDVTKEYILEQMQLFDMQQEKQKLMLQARDDKDYNKAVAKIESKLECRNDGVCSIDFANSTIRRSLEKISRMNRAIPFALAAFPPFVSGKSSYEEVLGRMWRPENRIVTASDINVDVGKYQNLKKVVADALAKADPLTVARLFSLVRYSSLNHPKDIQLKILGKGEVMSSPCYLQEGFITIDPNNFNPTQLLTLVDNVFTQTVTLPPQLQATIVSANKTKRERAPAPSPSPAPSATAKKMPTPSPSPAPCAPAKKTPAPITTSKGKNVVEVVKFTKDPVLEKPVDKPVDKLAVNIPLASEEKKPEAIVSEKKVENVEQKVEKKEEKKVEKKEEKKVEKKEEKKVEKKEEKKVEKKEEKKVEKKEEKKITGKKQPAPLKVEEAEVPLPTPQKPSSIVDEAKVPLPTSQKPPSKLTILTKPKQPNHFAPVNNTTLPSPTPIQLPDPSIPAPASNRPLPIQPPTQSGPVTKPVSPLSADLVSEPAQPSLSIEDLRMRNTLPPPKEASIFSKLMESAGFETTASVLARLAVIEMLHRIISTNLKGLAETYLDVYGSTRSLCPLISSDIDTIVLYKTENKQPLNILNEVYHSLNQVVKKELHSSVEDGLETSIVKRFNSFSGSNKINGNIPPIDMTIVIREIQNQGGFGLLRLVLDCRCNYANSLIHLEIDLSAHSTPLPENVDFSQVVFADAALQQILLENVAYDTTKVKIPGLFSPENIYQEVSNHGCDVSTFLNLIRVVKLWAYNRRIYDPLFGYLSSTSIMVTCAAAVRFNAGNAMTLDGLVHAYFDFMLNYFNRGKELISYRPLDPEEVRYILDAPFNNICNLFPCVVSPVSHLPLLSAKMTLSTHRAIAMEVRMAQAHLNKKNANLRVLCSKVSLENQALNFLAELNRTSRQIEFEMFRLFVTMPPALPNEWDAMERMMVVLTKNGDGTEIRNHARNVRGQAFILPNSHYDMVPSSNDPNSRTRMYTFYVFAPKMNRSKQFTNDYVLNNVASLLSGSNFVKFSDNMLIFSSDDDYLHAALQAAMQSPELLSSSSSSSSPSFSPSSFSSSSSSPSPLAYSNISGSSGVIGLKTESPEYKPVTFLPIPWAAAPYHAQMPNLVYSGFPPFGAQQPPFMYPPQQLVPPQHAVPQQFVPQQAVPPQAVPQQVGNQQQQPLHQQVLGQPIRPLNQPQQQQQQQQQQDNVGPQGFRF